jgi:hypothetical protein
MAKKKVEDIMVVAGRDFSRAEDQRKLLVAYYKDEDKVQIRIPPMYKPYFGVIMQVMINGISIAVKCDGSIQAIPETFADEVYERMMKVDIIENKKYRLSDIPNNLDRGTPGEAQLY